MMKFMMIAGLVALSGCSLLTGEGGLAPLAGPSEPGMATEIAPSVTTTTLGAQAVSADALDTTTPQEKAAALAAPATGGERKLGRVVVALGPPAEQGIWLKTALVTAPVMGRLVTAAGTSLAVELRPATGGALLSLAAFQALGLKLTDLPEVTVYGP
jgi:phage terminase large subunit-like protein